MKIIRVRIKTWEEMEREFGLAETGSINVQYTFTEEMEQLLPSDRIIEVEAERKRGPYLWCPEGNSFLISDDMISHTQMESLIKADAFKKQVSLEEI